MPMHYRPLGGTGLSVSELGLGCSALGGGLFAPRMRDAVDIVHRCLDAGMNFFDTSDTYSVGHSERVLGRAIRGRRDRLIIATKGGGTFKPLDRLLLHSRPLLRPIKGMLGKARR